MRKLLLGTTAATLAMAAMAPCAALAEETTAQTDDIVVTARRVEEGVGRHLAGAVLTRDPKSGALPLTP